MGPHGRFLAISGQKWATGAGKGVRAGVSGRPRQCKRKCWQRHWRQATPEQAGGPGTQPRTRMALLGSNCGIEQALAGTLAVHARSRDANYATSSGFPTISQISHAISPGRCDTCDIAGQGIVGKPDPPLLSIFSGFPAPPRHHRSLTCLPQLPQPLPLPRSLSGAKIKEAQVDMKKSPHRFRWSDQDSRDSQSRCLKKVPHSQGASRMLLIARSACGSYLPCGRRYRRFSPPST